jgi:hypothetical protein
MAVFPQVAEQLARLGANIEITAAANYFPQVVDSIIQIAVANGAHVTIEAGNYLPQALERFVQLGGRNITIRI